MKVACFDNKFHGFVDVKSKKDVDTFVITGRRGTDFNNAVCHFSNDNNIQKIVFTDGFDEFTLDDKKFDDIIWLVYDNSEFIPKHGEVIFIEKKDTLNKKCNCKIIVDDEERVF